MSMSEARSSKLEARSSMFDADFRLLIIDKGIDKRGVEAGNKPASQRRTDCAICL